MSFGLLLACTWRGRLAEAIAQSDVTLALGQLSGSHQVLSWAHGLRTLVDLRAGALARALDHGERPQLLSEGIEANPFSAVNGGWFGEALIEAGQPVRGREQILRALGGDALPAVEAAYRPYFYDVLAGAEATLGRRDQATSWASAAKATAAGLGLPGRDGAALHAASVAEQDPAMGARLALRARPSSRSLTRSRRLGHERSPADASAPRETGKRHSTNSEGPAPSSRRSALATTRRKRFANDGA